jgi:hypothetical protein
MYKSSAFAEANEWVMGIVMCSVPCDVISWDFSKPEPTYKMLTSRSLAGALLLHAFFCWSQTFIQHVCRCSGRGAACQIGF